MAVLNESILKTVIIIPTFNERENINSLVEALQIQFEQMVHEMHILVVDDSSPDGTADAVQVLQRKYANLHLIQGQKTGIGTAYIQGMRYAYERLDADVVFEMNADFSHKPEDVPRLMSEIEAGADFVIGSRFVSAGSIPEDWGLLRRLNSSVGDLAARHVAGISAVKDCNAGLRAIRTSVLRRIDLDNLRVQG